MPIRISVITAVRNRASTLADSLRSVHRQDWGAVEHVVIDACSTDGTADVISRHRSGIATLITEPDQGVYDALNKGIRHATGDVIGFMHADDEFACDDALSRIAAAFEDPGVDAVYGDLVYVREHDASHVLRYWRAGEFKRSHLAHGWMPPHPTFYVRGDVYRRFGAFDTRYKISADYENMLRILWRGGVKAAYIPQVLVRMRAGGISNHPLNLVRKSREDYAAMRENGIEALHALLLKNVTKLPQFMVKASAAH
jgi:glycosyltransferase